MNRRRAWLLALLAGAIGGACWLPLGIAPLLPLAVLIINQSLAYASTQRQALGVGLMFGVARYAVASHFLLALLRYSPLAIVFYLLAIVFVLPFALFESWGAFWLEQRTGLPRWLGFAILFTLSEKARTLGDLSFPADLLSNGLAGYPLWLGWSSISGPHGAAFWAVVVGGLLSVAWASRTADRRRSYSILALALALWIAPLAVSPFFQPSQDEKLPVMRVAIVQPFVKVGEKTDEKAWPRLLDRVTRLTQRAARNADLVIWPETTRPGPVIWERGVPVRDEPMEELSRELGVPILYGTDLVSFEKRMGRIVSQRIYNGAALVTPNGGTVDWYGKQRLLPFAEGVPFGDFFGWDPSKRKPSANPSLLTMLGNFSAGPKPTIFEVGSARIGVLICYEAFYPELARRYRNEGANALAVLTNDAWWGHGVFPYWHANMAAARARELDLPIIRAANNGISTYISRSGESATRTKLDEITVLNVVLSPSTSPPTFYARHGDLLTPLLLLLLAAAAIRGVIKNRSPTPE